jgi:hypothetical protein
MQTEGNANTEGARGSAGITADDVQNPNVVVIYLQAESLDGTWER